MRSQPFSSYTGLLAGCVVSHQPLVARSIFTGQHDCFLHPFVFLQLRLDLSQLDPEPADLYLKIVPAQKLDVAVRQPPPKIPRTVHPSLRIIREWILEEPRRRQLGTVQITARYPSPADIQFSRYSHRHRLPMCIQDVNPRVRQWTANGSIARPVFDLWIGRAAYRSFSRTVTIHNLEAWRIFFKLVQGRLC